MTLTAGLHYNVPEDVYRADPCPEPSLTQSIAKTLLTLTPAHYKYARQEPTTKFDIGHIAHRLILGRGREIEVLPSEYRDWKKKTAREMRDEMAENGKLGVLADDYDTGQIMSRAFYRQIRERGYEADWLIAEPTDRCAEVVAIAPIVDDRNILKRPTCDGRGVDEWNYTCPQCGGRGLVDLDGMMASDEPHSYWLRAMIDWLPSLTRIWDYKSTGMSVAQSIRASLPDWCIQAAMHERILNIIDPDNAGRREHRFVVQENFEPYALAVVRLTEAHLTVGRKQIAQAEAIWARCVATDIWPAYPLDDQSPDYPAWKLAQVMEGENEV